MAGVEGGRIHVSRYGSYKRDVARFTEWIGENAELDSIDEDALERFYAELARRVKDGKYSPDYARSIFGATKQFISWLASMKAISLPGNMASRKFRFGAGRTATKEELFTVDEVRRLVATSGERLRLFILLMLNCGMYQSDVSDLGENEVDWDAGTIDRPRSKTGKVAKYKLWTSTFTLLKAHRNTTHPLVNERGSRRVLVTSEGEPLCKYWMEGDKERRYDTVRGLYSRVQKAAGLTKPMKNLRKTSSTMLGSHRMFKFYAQYFLAQSPGTVADNHYVIPSEEEFFEALAWLGEQYGI
jgi:integrase